MAPAKHPRILLVDDEPDIIANLSRFLERAGFDVGTAADGGEALEFVASDGAVWVGTVRGLSLLRSVPPIP